MEQTYVTYDSVEHYLRTEKGYYKPEWLSYVKQSEKVEKYLNNQDEVIDAYAPKEPNYEYIMTCIICSDRAVNDYYCEEHACKQTWCQNKAQDGSKYCSEHIWEPTRSEED